MADDRGWGGTGGGTGGWPRSTGPAGASPDRDRLRADQRERRVQERSEAALARAEDRAVQRDQLTQDRERAREARRQEDVERRRARDASGETADVARRRGAGAARTGGAQPGELQRPRDTRSYHTVVDVGRMRELARRGASVAGLAGAFGVSVEEIEEALRDGSPDA